MGDEGDRQIRAKRKRMFFSRRAEEQTKWVVGMAQMQTAQIKSMLVCNSVRQRAYICQRSVKHSIRYSVSHLERTSSSFLIDVLQVCWLFDVCTAYKVQRLRYSQSVRQSLTVNSFVRGFTVLLFINWLVLQCSFIRQLFVRCVITDRCE